MDFQCKIVNFISETIFLIDILDVNFGKTKKNRNCLNIQITLSLILHIK